MTDYKTYRRSFFVLSLLIAFIVLFLIVLVSFFTIYLLSYHKNYSNIVIAGLIGCIVLLIWFAYRRILKILDRDEQKSEQLQEQMAESEKFTMSIVHEINNPLGSIANCLKLISAKIDRPQPTPEDIQSAREYLKTAEKELQRIIELAKNFMDLSRQHLFNPMPVRINEIINDLKKLIEARCISQNVKVIVELETALTELIADEQLLHQAIMNVMINALDAMLDGGVLTIKTSFDSMKKEAVIQITDTGCGILEENVSHLFEPFFSTKLTGKGTGLGLYNVKKAIDIHHGAVNVKSETNKGTSFFISLPMNGR